MNIPKKVAWVCGGTRMGETVAKALAQDGCRIVLTYRHSLKPVEDAVQRLQDQGVDAIALPCDISRQESIDRACREIVRQKGRLDILINLASIYEKSSLSKSKQVSKEWDAHMAANAKSAYLLSIAVAGAMRKGGFGRIVHISDWTSASGRPRYEDYSAYYVSKVAIKGIVEAMALELAPTVLVNAIAPGPILPPPGLTKREYNAVVQATPLKRWGGAEEIAIAVLFLTQTNFVTGETIRVDGGRHLS